MTTPNITGWDDLTFVSEEVDSESDVFEYTSFGFLDDTETFHYGELSTPKSDISLGQIKVALRPVPDADIFPPWPPSGADRDLRKAPETLPPKLYIKRPDLGLYSYLKKAGLQDQVFNSLVTEAQVLEVLSQHPHPNLIRYHGCRVTRGYVTGLVLDRHPRDLQTHVKDGFVIANKAAFMTTLESAIQHLHGLGWAHNDFKPDNVLVSEAGEPILIDFEGCQKFGTKLKHIRGTKEWIDGSMIHQRQSMIFLLWAGSALGSRIQVD